MSEDTTATQPIDVKGHHLISKVKELIHEGNVRQINIKDADGKSVLELPVSVGVVGFLLAPSMAAVGTLGALAADYSIEVQRHEGTDPVVTTIPSAAGAAETEKGPTNA